MRSKVPSGIRWTGHKKKEELLDDPLAESLFGLFSKVKDSPRHIAFKPEKLINEVYYICNRFYEDADPCSMLEVYAHDIETDMGWSYATELVMSMAYVVMKHQKEPPKKIIQMMCSIESCYHHCCYWEKCQCAIVAAKPTKKPRAFVKQDLASLLKNQADLEMFIRSGGLNVTINVNNEFKGNIDHMHLAHADVAVGMAEKGANVYHHKIDKYGKE